MNKNKEIEVSPDRGGCIWYHVCARRTAPNCWIEWTSWESIPQESDRYEICLPCKKIQQNLKKFS